MNIDFKDKSPSQIYHLMTQTIIPRPIAWVLSQNEKTGSTPEPSSSDDVNELTAHSDAENYNLAPFSYFNAICSDPPLCVLSLGKKSENQPKDTSTNLQEGAHCVIHIASVAHNEQVSASAASLKYGESEVEHCDLDLVEHQGWPLKRIASAKVAFLCKVYQRQEIGNAPQQLIFVEILETYIDDDAVEQNGNRISIDASKIDPLARLGANQYANLGSVFTKVRPD